MPKSPKKPLQKIQSHDPDSWLRKLRTPDSIKKWLQGEQDYISDYMVLMCQAEAKGPKGVADQVKRMGELIELIPDDTLRRAYYTDVKDNWGAFKKIYKLQKREDDTSPLPQLEKLSKDDKASFFDFGFITQDNAYYTMGRNGRIRICNFTIDILYFVKSENQPKYVCVFRNIFGRLRISAVTTDDFVTVGTFRKVVGRLGNYVFEGTDEHLNKIKLKLFHGVPEAEEPKYMGYSSSGDFYTWANGLYYNNEFFKSDKYGIVQLQHPIESMEAFKALPAECQVKFGEDLHLLDNPERFIEKNGEDIVKQYINRGKANYLSYYFLPFSTKLKISDHDDDDYEFERKFRHTPPAKRDILTFEKWSKLMVEAYGDNGIVAVVYYCMSVFRDIVYKHNDNYIPMLGFFGPRGSGKSKPAESLNRMFGEGLEDGVNLESGSTSTGIRRYLSSMQNAILWLNEYKNTLPDHVLGMIKGIADGSGKLTGRNTGGNETKTYKPRCAVVVTGQDLPTKDPGIFMRMIPCESDAKTRSEKVEKKVDGKVVLERSEKANKIYQAYDELKALEKDMCCTSVTLELLNFRNQIKEFYKAVEPSATEVFRDAITNELKEEAEDRILKNNSSLLTIYSILNDLGLKFPFDEARLTSCLLSKIQVQISIQQTSDDVEQYFNVLQSLINANVVKEEEHYKITKESNGLKKFYLRITPIHMDYRTAAQRAGMVPMTLGTIRSYLEKHRSFLEKKDDGVAFGNLSSRTSAMVFNYDLLLAQGIEFKMKKEPTFEI